MRLAHSGYLNYSTALDISSYLQYELEYVPWTAGFNSFEYLNEMLRRTGSYDKFKVNIRFTYRKIFSLYFRHSFVEVKFFLMYFYA